MPVAVTPHVLAVKGLDHAIDVGAAHGDVQLVPLSLVAKIGATPPLGFPAPSFRLEISAGGSFEARKFAAPAPLEVRPALPAPDVPQHGARIIFHHVAGQNAVGG